jgi:hypothetical protein
VCTRARPLFTERRSCTWPSVPRTCRITCAARVTAGFQVAVRPSSRSRTGISSSSVTQSLRLATCAAGAEYIRIGSASQRKARCAFRIADARNADDRANRIRSARYYRSASFELAVARGGSRARQRRPTVLQTLDDQRGIAARVVLQREISSSARSNVRGVARKGHRFPTHRSEASWVSGFTPASARCAGRNGSSTRRCSSTTTG